MASESDLPSRFPVGTRYVLEGEPGRGGKLRILSRYLVMPSGVRVDLMKLDTPARKAAALVHKGHARTLRRRAG
jgi:hypothetical protein